MACPHPYSECVGQRLRHALALLATAAAIGLSLAGCSYQLGSMASKDAGDSKIERTASTRPAPKVTRAPTAPPTDADLAFAKAAAAEVLARGGKDASQPWENPRTGARGTVTPIASAYPQDGTLCRDFLASYVREDEESWYQGGACRKGAKWEVRDIRPLHRT